MSEIQISDIRRLMKNVHFVSLSEESTMEEMINSLWHLPRDIISDGYEKALNELSKVLPMRIHEYPTGTKCWTWIVPEKWTCHEAYLETINGQRLFSYDQNPLHVVSYSLPFEGEISREELFQHLFVHQHIPEAIPFMHKYYERDWGLCCSKLLQQTLNDKKYIVKINTEFSKGYLKVGEIIVPGRSDESFVLCAHLCHPAMVNDDLSGVVAGIKVMRTLLNMKNLRYTYRFIIVPETIGSAAYLSHNEDLIQKMRGGLFLEMLGLKNPHALQLSFAGDTEIDKCLTMIMREHDSKSWTGDFMTVVLNDERQFNAPGVRVPMLSLSRVLPLSAPERPYLEYHSSYDTPERTSFKDLRDSCDLILKMINALENNYLPVNNYKGEIFLSRYQLHKKWYNKPEEARALQTFRKVIHLIDGTRTIVKIAEECKSSFSEIKTIIDSLHHNDLVENYK